MNSLYLAPPQAGCFANDNDALIPELWAQEALIRLEETMVMANLVHRDFEDEIQEFGDVVNTHRPADFKVKRKNGTDPIAKQDAQSTNVQVPLNQLIQTSFILHDSDQSKSFKDLVQLYLGPAVHSVATGVDRAVAGQVHQFLSNRVGRLSEITAADAGDWALDARQTLNVNKAPMQSRYLLTNPVAETAFLKNDLFISAEKRGDDGTALEQALLGRLYGFDTFMSQNVPGVSSGAEVATGTVTNALAAGGSGSQAVTLTGYEVMVGEYALVTGNGQPTHITAATTGAGDTTAVTLSEANKYATLAGAALTVFKSCDVNGAYAAGYSKDINVDGYAAGQAPQVGQLISFGTGGSRHTYTIIEATDNGADCDILLDRPLEAALADNDLAFPGPYGSFNMAFHRNAIALVTRPLAVPNERFGVMSGVASHRGLGIRVTMQYDTNADGLVVKFDVLAGVKVLDDRLCSLLLG